MFRAIHLKSFIVPSILFICCLSTGLRRIIPVNIEVQEGQDLQVRFLETLAGEATCYTRSPTYVNCNLKLGSTDGNVTCDERLHYWSVNGTCGFYITNVQKKDQGFWRLKSENDQGKRLLDVAEIKVLDKFYSESEKLEVVKGLTYVVSFADADEYCIVQHPYEPDKIIANNECSVEKEAITTADQGNWNAIVGIRGQIQEIVQTKNISVFHEHLDSGYTISTNPAALHLFCNIKSFDQKLSVCRFTRVAVDRVGLRLRDGLRKDRYEYYGNGLAEGECGLTIQSPEEKDYGQWYCIINVQANGSRPFGTSIQVFKPANKAFTNVVAPAKTPSRVWAASPVLTTEGETLKLECSTDVSLSYCWFSQPNGETFIPRDTSLTSPYSHVSFSNYNILLGIGNCTFTIQAAEKKHNGTWTCYMGPASLGMELSHQIVVRIAESSLAAVNKFVFTRKNGTVTLRCKTVPRVMALTYCRFYSPSRFGVNINERVTKDNPIRSDGVNYWYSGRSIAAGDCGLVIEGANSMHAGNWTCAAKQQLQESGDEASDTIHLTIKANDNKQRNNKDNERDEKTANAIIGVSVGVVAILIIFGFVIRKGCRNRCETRQPKI